MQIRNNRLIFDIDSDAEIIEKEVHNKELRESKEGKKYSQGRIFVHKKYIGKNCLLLLRDPKTPDDQIRYFDYDGVSYEYYDMLIRDVKSTGVSKSYQTGVLYLPTAWSGKRVVGIIIE